MMNFRKVATAALGLIIMTPTSGVFAPNVASAGVIISQIYGGGGNSGATLTNDYIELFNAGSTSQSLAGWSIQYASATGTGNFGFNASALTLLPSITLGSGQYLLIQEAQGAGGTTALPTPDVIDDINLSATAGKVALINSTSSLGCNGGSTPCSLAQLGLIIDLVGYGSANFFEGSGAAPGLNNTTAAFRDGGGCFDTNNNAADFSSAAPSPHNTASPLNICLTPSAPEPATLGILALGLAGLGLMRRRRAA